VQRITVASLLTFSLLLSAQAAPAAEPALPSGLDEPSLPAGLEIEREQPKLPSGLEDSLPQLPTGLGEEDEAEWGGKMESWADESAWQFDGFGEVRLGAWRDRQPFQQSRPLEELRLHLTTERAFDTFIVNLGADLLYDDAWQTSRPTLETGEGWLDIRSANILFSPLDAVDVRIGRQILTWGTGDLIFINDLFPKDWNSFLIGRDDAYLKAPSDAVKVSLFDERINLDLVYTPRFDADRFINGERASYYSTPLGRIAGTDAVVVAEKADNWLDDDELALRLYRNVATYELALYGYNGFWKSPAGANPVNGNAIFPRLDVIGASLRGPLLGGIVSGEVGRYDSRDDASGTNPLINNSELRLLLGHEHELIANLTLGLQWYTVRMDDYFAYRQTLPAGMAVAREKRHELGARLTWLALDQKLTTSLFVRYSGSDDDYYLRPKVRYSIDDHWSGEVGANLFSGKKPHTFFGQFEQNDNYYAVLRYGI